jgi:hypothetical protein
MKPYWRVAIIVLANRIIWRYLGDEWTPVVLMFGLAGLVVQHLFKAEWLVWEVRDSRKIPGEHERKAAEQR